METGPVQFGDDWPGVFIRGDEACWLGFSLSLVERYMLKDDVGAFDRMHIKRAAGLLSSCDAAKFREDGEMMKLAMPAPPPDWEGYVKEVMDWIRQRAGELNPDLSLDISPWGRSGIEDNLLGFSVSTDGSSISPEGVETIDQIDGELHAAGHRPIFSMQFLRDPE
jgi:uncharacterized protein YdhG (YjbR/CyaY superfamily)